MRSCNHFACWFPHRSACLHRSSSLLYWGLQARASERMVAPRPCLNAAADESKARHVAVLCPNNKSAAGGVPPALSAGDRFGERLNRDYS